MVGRYVGVGIDTYASHPKLEHAVAEVRAMAERLASAFAGEPLCDADEREVGDYLKAVEGTAPGGSLVLLWCGHGVFEGGRLALQTHEHRGEVDPAQAIKRCIRSGAAQLLFVFDTCYAGGGVPDVGAVAAALLRERPPEADHVWFGVLVSCSAYERAVDGAFGEAVARLFRDGPRSPDMQRRWSRHEKLIRGDDLAQALLEFWPLDDEQRPDFLSRGMPVRMLPNPWWDEGAPEVVVEHLLRAARGGESTDDRSWFTGRADEVGDVVAWVRSGTPGIRVVTGSAGTGKSAIVGRVVSLATPARRAGGGPPPADARRARGDRDREPAARRLRDPRHRHRARLAGHPGDGDDAGVGGQRRRILTAVEPSPPRTAMGGPARQQRHPAATPGAARPGLGVASIGVAQLWP